VSVVSAPPGSGKTVLSGSPVPLLEADRPAGARQEDRADAASAVIGTTRGPVNSDDPSDTALRQVGTASSDSVAGSAA